MRACNCSSFFIVNLCSDPRQTTRICVLCETINPPEPLTRMYFYANRSQYRSYYSFTTEFDSYNLHTSNFEDMWPKLKRYVYWLTVISMHWVKLAASPPIQEMKKKNPFSIDCGCLILMGFLTNAIVFCIWAIISSSICASFSFSFTSHSYFIWMRWIKAKNRSSGKKYFVRCVLCATQFSYKVAAVGRISISRSRASEMDRSTKIFLLSFALLIWVNISSLWSL